MYGTILALTQDQAVKEIYQLSFFGKIYRTLEAGRSGLQQHWDKLLPKATKYHPQREDTILIL